MSVAPQFLSTDWVWYLCDLAIASEAKTMRYTLYAFSKRKGVRKKVEDMPWKIVERRLGKAGGQKERLARQRGWDRKYGEGLWEIGYPHEGEFVSQTNALESVYQKSYDVFFDEHPELLQELIACAKVLRNPHALATTGVDLQVPAITKSLKSRGLELAGDEVLDVGSWQGQTSHPLSVRLSPLHIPCVAHEKMTLEKWWQTKKCLAVWED